MHCNIYRFEMLHIVIGKHAVFFSINKKNARCNSSKQHKFCTKLNIIYFLAIFKRFLEIEKESGGRWNFKQPIVHTTQKSMCISVSGVKQWNILTDDIKESKNLVIFKKTLLISLIAFSLDPFG